MPSENKNSNMEEIRAALLRAQYVVIAPHTNPDGDAIGSALGLALALKKLGKRAVALLDPYAEKFDVIPGKELIYAGDVSELQPDTFVALDAGSADRLGSAQSFLESTAVTLNIDHHISNTGFGRLNYVRAGGSSTSEVVFDLLSGMDGFTLDTEIAAALYAGILTDTGGFRYNCATAETYIAAAKLVALGIPFTKIYDSLMFSKTFAGVKAFGCAVASAEKVDGIPVCLAHILPENLSDIGATAATVLGAVVVGLLGVKVAISVVNMAIKMFSRMFS